MHYLLEERVRIVRFEVLAQDSETLSVLSDLFPVSLDVLQVLGEVCIGPLKNLAIDSRCHLRLDINVSFIGRCRIGEDKVGRALYGLQERSNLLWVVGNESIVRCERL